MNARDEERCRSDKPAEWPDVTGRREIADGDIVRCDIAPYFFRARTSGAALLLEPIREPFWLDIETESSHRRTNNA